MAHNELLHKLWNFGITDDLWLWIQAYLSNRHQCVSIGQSVSSVVSVVSGVPQGSILGPLLFLIFINDLPTTMSSSLAMLFADDAKCVMPVSSLSDCVCLQSDLTSLAEWSFSWNLILNEDKCSIVSFTTNQTPVTCINGKPSISRSAQRDLGVVVSADFQWRPHYQLITSKAYRMLGMLRRNFSCNIAVSAKRSLYISLVRSHLQYCSPLWRPHLLVDIKCLESVQRRATKYIVSNSTMNYKDRLTQLHLLPLMMEFEIADIIFLVRSLKYPSHHFNIHKFIQFSNHTTRSSSFMKLKHSVSRNNTQTHLYFNRIPRLWNSLPSFNIDLPLSTIKAQLRAYFRNHFSSNFDPNDVCTYHYQCPCHKCSILPISTHFNMPLS